MQFESFTEEEILKSDRIEPGIYPFKIAEAIEKRSQAGNAMLVLYVDIKSEDGISIQITDYLVSNVRWKLKQFAKATGLEEKLKSGGLSDIDVIKKTGACEVGLEKNEKGEFLKIKKYIERDKNSIEKDDSQPFVDDEVPF